MKLLDTTVAIDHLRGDEAAVALLRSLLENDEVLATSEIVRFELLADVRDEEVDALERFFSAVSWIPIDETVSRTAGLLARVHGRRTAGSMTLTT